MCLGKDVDNISRETVTIGYVVADCPPVTKQPPFTHTHTHTRRTPHVQNAGLE